MQTDASEERLSKYELIRPLGAGGMGEVYLAHDTVLRRQVAIKFVSPSNQADAMANARLLREARAVAALDHPGICPVYDVSVDSRGRTCIVMQYVEGETLAERLQRGPLAPSDALHIGADIADALAVAHAHGIVHRDLKPQNVILTADGRPKLLDFGIAYADVPPDAVAQIATHTATTDWSAGAIVGTPAYMSPEQVLRKPFDGRSDLFSLGAVLFECLTGTPAFRADSAIDTWARVVYVTPPAPSTLNPRVPAAADAAIARLLAKEPEARFASASEAAHAVRQAASGAAGSGLPMRRLAAAAAVMGAIALGGYGAWRLTRERPLPPPPPAAKEYYDRGLQYLRDGAYARAGKALTAAVEIHREYPQALARLAEAYNELDEETRAQKALLRIGDITRAGLVLPRDVAVRVDAISALIERDLPRAEAGYRALTDQSPQDRGAWLDLARVRQVAGHKVDAHQAAEQALKISPNYAAAHLRLGSLAAEALRRDEAVKEFKEAARLYALDSVTEGQAEAMLQRAYFLDAIGDSTASRQVLQEAEKLLALAESPYQQVRAAMLRSSLAASAGDLKGAGRVADEAVKLAQGANLDTVAADALIQWGTTLWLARDYDAARTDLERGIALAKGSGAKLVALRGTLQLASLYLEIDQPADANNLASGMLDFAHYRYPRFEMIALSIVARSQEQTDPRTAEKSARQVLAMARALQDDREVAGALDGLVGPALVLGSLPEVLDLRTQLEQLYRQQQDTNNLAQDLAGRADMLIRLGRLDQATEPLREIDAGAAAGNQVYASRARRVSLLRAMAAVESRDFPAATRHAQDVLARSATMKSPDITQITAEALLAVATPGRRTVLRAWPRVKPSAAERELRYWRGIALLTMGDFTGAEAEAGAALADIDRRPSAEFEWRMTAIAAAAARRRGDETKGGQMAARAQGALDSLRAAWKVDAVDYERRADLTDLRRAAGIS
jgi:tRNA A-37 threonylcarbamoyl transferase component Bud32/tetratricopeptide (TPR) repeat protein